MHSPGLLQYPLVSLHPGAHIAEIEKIITNVETSNDSDWEQRVLSPLLERLSMTGCRSEHREGGGRVMGFSTEPGNVSKPKLNGFLTKPSGFDYLGLPLTFTFLHKVSLLLCVSPQVFR